MSFEVSFRGGARIGWTNATWSFARLTSTAQSLVLSMMGDYSFAPGQVVAIERESRLFSSGVRIRHNRADYPETVIFWCLGPVDAVLEEIHRSGFRAQGQALPRAPGFPVRWSVVIGLVVAWNLLLLADIQRGTGKPGSGALVASALLLLASTATLLSAGAQRLVLRPGHDVGEIRSPLRLLQVVSGLMLVLLGMDVFG